MFIITNLMENITMEIVFNRTEVFWHFTMGTLIFFVLITHILC